MASQSQFDSQAQAHSQTQPSQRQTLVLDCPSSTKLSLKKFSSATTISLQGNITWNHLSQLDLLATFDYVTVTNNHGFLVKKLVLEITRTREVLERIFLDDLMYQARLDEDRLKTQTTISDSSRIVLIIVKRPFLAVRYQLSNGQIRRFQMNFSPDSGFDRAVQFFIDHGLPIRDRNAESRPQPQVDGFSTISAFQVPNQPLQVARVPSHGDYVAGEASAMIKRSSGTLSDPSTISSNYHSHSVDNTIGSSTMNFIAKLPTSAVSGNQSHAANSQRLTSTYTPVPTSQTNNGIDAAFGPYLRPPSSLQQAQPSNVGSHDPVRRTLFEPALDTLRLVSAPMPLEPTFDALRPVSAPVSFDPSKDPLPPKRILPFPSSESSKKQPAQSEEQNAIKSTYGSKPADDALPQASKKQAASKKKQPAKPRPSSKTSKDAATPESTQQAPAPEKPKKGRGSRPSTAASTTSNAPLSSAAAKPARKLTKAKQAPKYTSTAAQTSDVEQADLLAPAVPELDVATEWQSAVDAFVAKHKSRPPPPTPKAPSEASKPVADLEEYVSRPVKERRAAIDEMIAELIMDENFTTLCEDVEGAWRRIGLGM